MLIRAVVHLGNLTVVLAAVLVAGSSIVSAQLRSADTIDILRAVAAIREGQGRLAGEGPWRVATGDAAAIELARAASINYHPVRVGAAQTPCPWNPAAEQDSRGGGYDAAVDVQFDGPDAARVKVTVSCANPPGWTHKTYYFGRFYSIVRVGGRWTARADGFEITMPVWSPPNFPLERTAGSHALAAAAQRECYTGSVL